MDKVLLSLFLIPAALLVRHFWRRPVAALALLAFTAPFEKIGFYRGITWKPFLFVFPLALAAYGIRLYRGKDRLFPLNGVDKALAVIMAVNFLSAVTALDPLRSVRMGIQLGILYVILHLFIRWIRCERDVREVLFYSFLSGGLTAAYGLLQLAGGLVGINTHILLAIMPHNPTLPYMLTIPGAVYFEGLGHVVRVSSTFFDWNIFGGYLVFLLCFAGAFLIRRVSWHGRWSHLAVLTAVGVVLLVFSFSRSAWLGAGISVLVLAWLYRSMLRKALHLKVLAPLFALVLLLMVLPGRPLFLVGKRLQYMFGGDPSVSHHGIYGERALRMFSESPLLGIGLHNFAVFNQRIFNPQDIGATAHSSFLTYFAETGMLGGVANLFFHLLVLSILARGIRRTPANSISHAVLCASIAGYLGILVCNLFYFFNNQVFIWTFLGLGLAEADRVTGWTRVDEREQRLETGMEEAHAPRA